VAAAFPGVTYQAFDLFQAGPDRIQEMFTELVRLFESGALAPPPVTVRDIRRVREALRFMSQARHVGKIVLSVPAPPDPGGWFVVTGASGGLGSLVARHLVTEHGARHVALISRSGHGDAEVPRARTRLVACDVADRRALAAAVADLTAERPISMIVHAAAVVDDAVVENLTPEQVERVLRPKVDGAWNLHELTREPGGPALVLFSSAAGLLGAAGQANYAAANAFVDALAHTRRAEGLPAVSLAWGLWAERTRITGRLSDADLARMERGGIGALPTGTALRLFDAGLGADEALLVPLGLDPVRAGHGGQVPALLRTLVRGPRRVALTGAAGDGGLADRLAGMSPAERERLLTDLVRGHVATVLGHRETDRLDLDRAFKDHGFDSLTAVELRNRLGAATGLRLPATLVFDHPTPAALAGHIHALLAPDAGASVLADLDRLEAALAGLAGDPDTHAEALRRLRALLAGADDAPDGGPDLDSATDDELFDLVDNLSRD